MASQTIPKLDPFYRGDTVSFSLYFAPPFANFDWSTVTLDSTMTNIPNPTDNNGAAAFRQNQMLTVGTFNNVANSAQYIFQLTLAEAKSLVPGAKYYIQAQCKQTVNGIPYQGTGYTGSVEIYQDYVI